MPPRRYALGAMRELDNELRKARAEEKQVVERVKRLQAAQAALRGEPAPRKHARRLAREDIHGYLLEHPGSLAVEIAEAFGVPATNVGSHLSKGKKAGEFQVHGGRWSAAQPAGAANGREAVQ